MAPCRREKSAKATIPKSPDTIVESIVVKAMAKSILFTNGSVLRNTRSQSHRKAKADDDNAVAIDVNIPKPIPESISSANGSVLRNTRSHNQRMAKAATNHNDDKMAKSQKPSKIVDVTIP